MKVQTSFQEWLKESQGLWHNIRAKRARGERPARKGSKAYKKAVAAAKLIKDSELLESSYKSLGLGEPVELRPGITYDIDAKTIGEDSPEFAAEFVADELGLKVGEIFLDDEEFLISGVTKSGNNLYISQEGEYDMYGGPYDPKMSKPSITINGEDMTDTILAYYNQQNPDNVEPGNYPDLQYIIQDFGYLFDKSPQSLKTFFTSKKFGL